jgi:DNA topoisomerase-2
VQELESAKGEYGCNGLEKVLKLYSTSSTTNMHLFDHEDKLKKYEKVEDIINDYFEIRIKHYVLRKAYIIHEKEEELVVLQNKARYIQEVLDGTIDLRRLKQNEIHALLQTKQYVMISHDKDKDNDKDYKYLIKMPMDSVSIENVEHLLKVCTTTQHELDIIKSTSEKQMWLNELEVLEHEYKQFQIERNEAQCDVKTEKAVKQIKKEKAPKKGK